MIVAYQHAQVVPPQRVRVRIPTLADTGDGLHHRPAQPDPG